ncbi:uncharacterized protein LOC124405723 [Diprion similis]|uniref:uncharacterized protein LOC124405723 n=1 Tax=Diprion similis TaxID=362088 RepID=UPI001EF78D29|nr:uncharacterized protein LOC124405723 [Diprion similis]
MWYLKSLKGDIIYLKPNKLMIVSRKEGYEILLKDDASISKLHATVTVRPKVNFKNNEPSSTVIVQDTNSKYGTFVINSENQQRKLTPGDHVLNEKDRIKFGLQQHIFTLHYIPLIISTSTLNSEEKVELQNIVETLDGVIVEKWKEYCTHLTVSNATLTAQVVQALAFGTQIVSMAYWRAVIRSVENKKELPGVKNYLPSIKEGLIDSECVSIETNTSRKVLFRNLCFVCLSASQCGLKDIVQCAGGKLELFIEGQRDVKQLSSENFIVLQLENSTSQPLHISQASYDEIQSTLEKKKLRLIPESEISLAILYCSTEKYCNPKFNFKRLLGVGRRNKNVQLSSTILAPDTEDMLSTIPRQTDVIINESFTPSEQIEEAGNSRKGIPLLGTKQADAENVKDSSPLPIVYKKSTERPSFGSEESSRDGYLIIDEIGSDFESDSNDTNAKKSDVNEFDNVLSKSKVLTNPIVGQRITRQLKSQLSDRSKTKNVHETYAHGSSRKSGGNFLSSPSTSKDKSWKKAAPNDFEDEENFSLRKPESITDQQSREENPRGEKILSKKLDPDTKMSNSAHISDKRKSRKQTDMDNDDMFGFVNEGARKKRNVIKVENNELFELLEDPTTTNSPQEDNIFQQELQKTKCRNIQKRKRSVSLTSNNSSIDEEKPEIKIEAMDTDEEMIRAPLVLCKKEDISIDETCNSTVVPLLRTDIDVSLNATLGNYKTFIKMYTLTPKERVKIKNMYVYESEDDSISKSKVCEEEISSSEDENDDFRFHSKQVEKKVRARR